MNTLKTIVSLILVFFTLSCVKPPERIEDLYNKKEYYITMSDGVKLCTIVYSPKDKSEKYPMLLNRTPYSIGPYGIKGVNKNLSLYQAYLDEKYIFVFQDVRGRFMSEGEFEDVRPYIPNKKTKSDIDESSDTYDTIEWLVNNVHNNNGKVGIWGISYPGFYAAMALLDPHPSLAAASPQAPIADWFIGDDFHHNGALFLSDAFHFYSVFGVPRDGLIKEWPKGFAPDSIKDGYQFYKELGPLKNINEKYFKGRVKFWNDVIQHPNYDQFWQARNILQYYKNIKTPVLLTGGWFDAEDLYGVINSYKTLEKNSPDNKISLIMGPWFHGGWVRSKGENLGEVQFLSQTSDYYLKEIELPFFNYYLKGKGNPVFTEVNIFETGSNQWKKFDQWPPADIRAEKWYLSDDNFLNISSVQKKGLNGSYEYISDPDNPVPYTSVKEYETSREFMVENQNFASQRIDVVTLRSEILDSSITIAGPINADLYVSTSGTDADWVVKVIDVYPDTAEGKMSGYQMLLRWEIMRGKYRNSYEKPEPFIPGQPTLVKIKLQDVCHTFQKGHKIMIQIQSSIFPMADMNPQIFTDIYSCDEKDFTKVVNKIYYSGKYPSAIAVQRLK